MLTFALAHAADPGTASFTSKGFTISDAAGDNLINLGVTLQPRLTATLDADPGATDAERVTEMGVRTRRALFTAGGVIADRVEFKFRIDAAKALNLEEGQASKVVLDDAQLVFRIADPVELSVGQWKLPFLTQQVTSDSVLLFPERAPTSDGVKFGDVDVKGYSRSRDAGIAIQGSAGVVEYAAGAFNGESTNTWPQDDGFMYLARLAVTPLGEFKYDEVDFERGKPRLGIGTGFTWDTQAQYEEDGTRTLPATDLRASADVRLAVQGLSLNVEGAYGSDGDTSRGGFYAQAGYYLPAGVAPGLRYARLDPDLSADGDAVSQVDAALNWFLPDPTKPGETLRHRAKVTAAYTGGFAAEPLFHTVMIATQLVI